MFHVYTLVWGAFTTLCFVTFHCWKLGSRICLLDNAIEPTTIGGLGPLMLRYNGFYHDCLVPRNRAVESDPDPISLLGSTPGCMTSVPSLTSSLRVLNSHQSRIC
ncbi:hypothetical protein ASPTUDRAFT_45834 [Aspergillus tubingensis CBS 134.48]|uniref:Uncharacterized protein n=1 Tax=Aspergillus tubingensis (strain CBS 134.48) TaxID=767770 RepID=A0A1L9MZC9_ASPTC|nr:hypothetical protein ASPTUDRAFT_45834 [Aspergillus tubingensis CBS 134.48]